MGSTSLTNGVHLITLLISVCFLISVEAQNCSIVTESDLGNPSMLSSEGIISAVQGRALVQVLQINIVCLSSGQRRNTYSTASVLARYNCLNCTASMMMQELVNQFTFPCNMQNQWVPPSGGITPDPMANFTTPLDRNCGLCLYPSPDDFRPDPVTHCVTRCENSKCIGAQLCSQRAPGGNVSCCDFFDNDTCVTRTCGNFLVPRLPDFTCVPPAFIIENTTFEVFLDSNNNYVALYIYDTRMRPVSPVSIMCPYLEPMWFYQPVGSMRVTITPTPLPLGNNATVSLIPPTVLSVTPAPLSLYTYTFGCTMEGLQDISIILTTDNPFLSVMPEALILPLGDRQFQISITAASTTGREIPTTPNLSSFTFTLTDVNRGNIPVQIIGTTLASQYIRRVTLDATNITRAELQVQLDIPGLQSVTRMVSVAARALPELPRATVLNEGDRLFLNCTPTSPSNVTISFLRDLFNAEGFVQLQNGPVLEINNTVPSNTGRYRCVAFGNNVQESTLIVVLPRTNMGLEIFYFRQRPSNSTQALPDGFLLNEFRPGETLEVQCFGLSGHGQLVWSTDEGGELQRQLAAIGTGSGTIIISGMGEIRIAPSSPHVTELRVRLFSGQTSPFMQTFMCSSRESGTSRRVTLTTASNIVVPSQENNYSPSVGQAWNLTFLILRSNQRIDPVLIRNGREVRGGLRMDSANPQLFIHQNPVVLYSHAGLYSVEIIQDSPEPLFVLNFTVNIISVTLSTNISSLSIQERTSFELFCNPSDPNVQLDWSFIRVGRGEGPQISPMDENYQLSPPLLHHRLLVRSAREDGTFICQVRLNSSISRAIQVNILQECAQSFAVGVLWPASFEGDIQSISCSSIDSRFSNFVRASRLCGDGGVWSDVDFSNCTLDSLDTPPFILLWLNFDPQSLGAEVPPYQQIIQEISSNISFHGGVEVIAGSASLTIESRDVNLQPEDQDQLFVRPATYKASLNVTDSREVDLTSIRSRFVSIVNFIGGTGARVYHSSIASRSEGAIAFQPSNECQCFPFIFFFEVPSKRQVNVVPITSAPPFPRPSSQQLLCVGPISSPCSCPVPPAGGNSPCQCVAPFIGDGERCIIDGDQDGYPITPLSTCSDAELQQQTPTYCANDTCPLIYNLPQSDTAPCTMPTPSGGVKCLLERDPEYNILWGYTDAGQTVTQACGQNFTGNATRPCGQDGKWLAVNSSDCARIAFQIVQQRASLLLGMAYSIAGRTDIIDDINQVATITNPDGISLVPSDLETTSLFIRDAVDYLRRGPGETGSLSTSRPILNVISNVVSRENRAGAALLRSTKPKTTYSQDILNSAERYGLWVSSLLEQNDTNSTRGERVVLAADNVVLEARSVVVNDQLTPLTFPEANISNLTDNPTASVLARAQDASITLPTSLLRQRANSGRVRVANILFQSITEFLPSAQVNNITQSPVSIIISSQVQQQGGNASIRIPDPVNITFTVLNRTSADNLTCSFFDFNELNSFSGVGVSTTRVATVNGSNALVDCQSSHLTSFAVLVNVAGVEFSEALNVVSYIGLGLSLACLLATIIFFLTFGKKLFSAVHNFVHLNLAIALFLAYLTFAIGVDLAKSNEIGCKFVTALLHYLFLSAFCWMLCEGVMLYLMLWVVFSSLSKKWWFFLLLGWFPPVIFVVIGLATSLSGYAVYDTTGKIRFCWLSSAAGIHAIWNFVAPMLAIILINVVFLVLVLVSLVRSRSKKQQVKDKGKRIDLVTSTIKASIILLPLLGLTWVFGLFAVNQNTVVFAWIFTILNAFQGVAIFVLHVLRHEKIWGKCKKKYHLFESTTSKNSNSQAIYKKKDHSGTGSTSGGTEFSLKTKESGISYGDESKNKEEGSNASLVGEENEYSLQVMEAPEPSKHDLSTQGGEDTQSIDFRSEEKA